jgi:hypothetical protein
MQDRQDLMLVQQAKTALKLQDYLSLDLWAGLASYREYLKSKFDNDRRRQKFKISDFLASAAGVFWQSTDSALIVLYGLNEHGIGTVNESWLSPVTIDIAQELHTRQSLVAVVKCNKDSTVETILSQIIVQLLELNPAVLRDGKDWYRISNSLAANPMVAENGLRTALLTILDLQEDLVYIILDRPELSEEDDPKSVIEALVYLAEKVKSRMKVLVTTRAEFWDFEDNFGRKSVLRRNKDSESHPALKAIRIDQRRL